MLNYVIHNKIIVADARVLVLYRNPTNIFFFLEKTTSAASVKLTTESFLSKIVSVSPLSYPPASLVWFLDIVLNETYPYQTYQPHDNPFCHQWIWIILQHNDCKTCKLNLNLLSRTSRSTSMGDSHFLVLAYTWTEYTQFKRKRKYAHFIEFTEVSL